MFKDLQEFLDLGKEKSSVHIEAVYAVGNVAYVVKIMNPRCTMPHRCGYIVFPEKYDNDDFESRLDVHGGVTFEDRIADGKRIYGFDCAHCDDYDNPKDLNYVKKEIKAMLHQINEAKRGRFLQ